MDGGPRVLWWRLGLFPADFGLDGARSVAAGDGLDRGDVPGTLADLVNNFDGRP